MNLPLDVIKRYRVLLFKKDENETNYYQYYFFNKKVLNIEYNATLGKILCKDGINFSEAECNETLFK